MYKVTISTKAQNNLSDIARYIAQDSPSRAITFTHSIIDNFKARVSLFPKTGTKCKDFYYTVYKSYLIFYDIDENATEVVILHVIHSAQYTAYKDFLI